MAFCGVFTSSFSPVMKCLSKLKDTVYNAKQEIEESFYLPQRPMTELQRQMLLERTLENCGLVPLGMFTQYHQEKQDREDEEKAKQTALQEEN